MDLNVRPVARGQPGGARATSYPRQPLGTMSCTTTMYYSVEQQTPGSERAGLFYSAQSGVSPIPQQGAHLVPGPPAYSTVYGPPPAYDTLLQRNVIPQEEPPVYRAEETPQEAPPVYRAEETPQGVPRAGTTTQNVPSNCSLPTVT